MKLSDFAELSVAEVAKAFAVASPSQKGQLFSELYEQVQLQAAACDSAVIDLEERIKALESQQ